jgi:hypothetical protein
VLTKFATSVGQQLQWSDPPVDVTAKLPHGAAEVGKVTVGTSSGDVTFLRYKSVTDRKAAQAGVSGPASGCSAVLVTVGFADPAAAAAAAKSILDFQTFLAGGNCDAMPAGPPPPPPPPSSAAPAPPSTLFAPSAWVHEDKTYAAEMSDCHQDGVGDLLASGVVVNKTSKAKSFLIGVIWTSAGVRLDEQTTQVDLDPGQSGAWQVAGSTAFKFTDGKCQLESSDVSG